MAGMADILGNLATPIDPSRGIQAGVDIAARGAQIAQQKAEIQFRQQQLEIAKDDHLTASFQDAVAEPDAAIRKLKLKRYSQVAQNMGRPVDQDGIDVYNKSEDARTDILSQLSQRHLMDPQDRQDFQSKLIKTGMDPMKVASLTDELNKQQNELEKAKALGQNRLDLVGARGTQSRIKELMPYATSPEDAQALQMGTSHPGFMNALENAQQAEKAAKEKALGNQTTKADASAQNADTNSGKLVEAKRHNVKTEAQGDTRNDIAKQRVDVTKQALALRGQSLNLGQERLLSGVEKTPTLSTLDGSIKDLNDAMALVRPGMKWIDLMDTNTTFLKALKGSSRVAASSEEQRQFTDASTTISKWIGMAQRHEEGGPSKEEIALEMGRINHLKDAMSANYDNLYKNRLQGLSKTIPSDVLQTHFESNKKSQNSKWDANLGAPAMNQGSEAAQRTGSPNPPQAPAAGTAPSGQGGASNQINPQIEKQRAINAITAVRNKTLKGTTEQIIRDKFKSKTGQDLDFQ